MLSFKDFLQWIRESGERFVVLDANGEPEFMITPAQAPRKMEMPKKKDDDTVAIINKTIAEVADRERESVTGWDAMADTLHASTPSPLVGEGTGEGGERSTDEPTFQFETIDE